MPEKDKKKTNKKKLLDKYNLPTFYVKDLK